MGLTMAPATESIMGSLPRAKAGVGSAVNDTTRQVGGALGVAIIGTLVASVYSSGISSIASSAFGLTAAQTTAAKGSLGSALTLAADPNSGIKDPAAFAQAAKVHFVDGLSTGLRVGAVHRPHRRRRGVQVPAGLRQGPAGPPGGRIPRRRRCCVSLPVTSSLPSPATDGTS